MNPGLYQPDDCLSFPEGEFLIVASVHFNRYSRLIRLPSTMKIAGLASIWEDGSEREKNV